MDHLILTFDRLTSKSYGFSMWVHLPGMRDDLSIKNVVVERLPTKFEEDANT